MPPGPCGARGVPTSAPAATSMTRSARWCARSPNAGWPTTPCCVLRRPWRHAGRARPLVQDALVRVPRPGCRCWCMRRRFAPRRVAPRLHRSTCCPPSSRSPAVAPTRSCRWTDARCCRTCRTGRPRRGHRRIHGRGHARPAADDPPWAPEVHPLAHRPPAAVRPARRPDERKQPGHRPAHAAAGGPSRPRWPVAGTCRSCTRGAGQPASPTPGVRRAGAGTPHELGPRPFVDAGQPGTCAATSTSTTSNGAPASRGDLGAQARAHPGPLPAGPYGVRMACTVTLPADASAGRSGGRP